jgi:photosystem II stability/assembly factor-like uncharacterized protein
MKTKLILIFAALGMAFSATQAQTKLNSSTIGMIEARCIGSAAMSGRITAVDANNKEPRIFYIGTAGGGIWKTTNAGVSFEPVFDKHCQSIGALAVDQNHPDVVWAGTGESNMRNSVSVGNGLYKSSDAGKNWVKVGLENSEHISKILIDPNNSDIVYVAVPGHLWGSNPDRGLYKTTDGGATWEKILYISETAGCSEVIMDPTNSNRLYASTWEFKRTPYSFNSGGKGSAIYKSEDAGKTWRKLSNGLPEGDFGRVALALAPSEPNNLLAIVESKKTGLYISADGGETWKNQSSSNNVCARPFYFSTIVVDPKDSKRVYRPAYTFSISKDGGYSFIEPQYFAGIHPDHHTLWINPANTSHLLLGTDGGLYQSLDKGNSWTFFWNLPVSQFYHVALDNKSPYNVYGGLQDNGSWKAPSQKAGGIKNGDWEGLYGGDGFWVQPDGEDPDVVYAESQGGSMGRINRKYNMSQSIQPKQGPGDEELRFNWNTPIVRSFTNPKVLYTGSQYLYKTMDKGITWIKISPDLTTNDKTKQKQEESGGLTVDNSSAENHCTIFTIADSPLDENIVWVGTDDGNLQYTTDGGKNWNNVTANYSTAGIPKGTWVSSIQPGRFNKSEVYVTFDNHAYGDMNTYVAKSSDFGKTWRMFKCTEFTGFAHKILEDLKNKDLLFLGTEMGCFMTIDGGETWVRMKNNIPEYALVRDLAIHPETNDLVIATHGRGIYIMDDISPLRSLTNDLMNKDFAFLPSRKTPVTNGRFGGGGGQGGEFVAPNYTDQAVFTYYLKDRLNSGDVRIEIYDENGMMLYDMAGTKRKGINKVYWGMRMKPPKVAETGATLDMTGFVSPLVNPGKYTVKLKVADKVYTDNIELIEDPNSPFTKEELALQRNTSKQMYELIDRFSYSAQQLVEMQKGLNSNLGEIKNTKDKKLLSEYNDKLESIRKTMVATKLGTAITGEKQMREKIAELYAEISMYQGRPTEYQLIRLKGFDDEIKKKAGEVNSTHDIYLEKVNKILVKNGKSPLKLLTMEKWKNETIKP